MAKKPHDSHLLAKNDHYQVFLMACHCRLPVTFARHMWLVVNRKGTFSRWEVLIEQNCCGTSWGHLHKDAQLPFKPLGLLAITGHSPWDAETYGLAEGVEGSLAHRMADVIESSMNTYPHLHTYKLLGPNSNTYVRWVLDQFPEFKVGTPWNAVGKGYKYRV